MRVWVRVCLCVGPRTVSLDHRKQRHADVLRLRQLDGREEEPGGSDGPQAASGSVLVLGVGAHTTRSKTLLLVLASDLASKLGSLGLVKWGIAVRWLVGGHLHPKQNFHQDNIAPALPWSGTQSEWLQPPRGPASFPPLLLQLRALPLGRR